MVLGPDAQADIGRYRFHEHESGIQRSTAMTIFANPGLQSLLLYRLARRLHTGRPTLRKKALGAAYPILSRINDIVNGIFISHNAIIGPGCYIAHYGGVVIGAGAVIGANCNIANNTSIGAGSPTLGDRVLVAVGARVVGDVRIGSDVAVGANAVITRDVPDRAVAVGVPGRVVSYAGSFKQVRYPGAESDPDRIAALNSEAPQQFSG
jgi:serine O-acetyltransferase